MYLGDIRAEERAVINSCQVCRQSQTAAERTVGKGKFTDCSQAVGQQGLALCRVLLNGSESADLAAIAAPCLIVISQDFIRVAAGKGAEADALKAIVQDQTVDLVARKCLVADPRHARRYLDRPADLPVVEQFFRYLGDRIRQAQSGTILQVGIA